MAKQIIKKGVKETIKKFKPNPNSTKNFGKGAPEKGTVGAQKKAKPTGVTKAKPTGVRKKAAINKVKAENLDRQSKIAAAVRTQKRNESKKLIRYAFTKWWFNNRKQ